MQRETTQRAGGFSCPKYSRRKENKKAYTSVDTLCTLLYTTCGVNDFVRSEDNECSKHAAGSGIGG